ncbi:Hypothetical protein, putative [Bodo saltans]|uniref:C3H1-type domain-containing protein n=1 Tax=Bodo saltans TaxID=75058 RepID=A0A0S4JQG8_BODSA|nr:Hypothetical protein, putative [Bodo saltans]|eukprot:CUG92438.1 Hypothetical protein, putative [Bodo saltans]
MNVKLTPQQEQLQRAEMLRNKGIICLQYFSGKSCRRSNCPFAHIVDGEVRLLPDAPCVFFQQGSCLRERCKFFHGPKKDFDNMKAAGQTTYRPQDFMPVALAPTDEAPLAFPPQVHAAPMQSMQPLATAMAPMQTAQPYAAPMHYMQPMQTVDQRGPSTFHYNQQLNHSMMNLPQAAPPSAPQFMMMHDAPAPQLVHHQVPYISLAPPQVLSYPQQFLPQVTGSYYIAQ